MCESSSSSPAIGSVLNGNRCQGCQKAFKRRIAAEIITFACAQALKRRWRLNPMVEPRRVREGDRGVACHCSVRVSPQKRPREWDSNGATSTPSHRNNELFAHARELAPCQPDDDRSQPEDQQGRRGAPVTRKDLQFVLTRIGLVKPKASMLFAICFICAREWRRAFWSRDAARRGRSFRRRRLLALDRLAN